MRLTPRSILAINAGSERIDPFIFPRFIVEAPEAYKTAGMANLIGGAINVVVTFLFFISTCWFIAGFWFLIPMAASGYQMYIGNAMRNGEANPAAKNAAIAGIVGGLLSFNWIAVGASAYAFMQTNDEEVAGWIESNS